MKNTKNIVSIPGYRTFSRLNKKLSITHEEAEEMFRIITSVDLKRAQNYESYNEKEKKVCDIFSRRLIGPNGAWHTRIHPEYFNGIERLGIGYEIPRIEVLSEKLEKISGFKLYFVPGHTNERLFILALARGYFPVTIWLRDIEQLNYIEEPDMGHEVYGHLPLLTNISYARASKKFAEVYIHLQQKLNQKEFKRAVEYMGRFYWWTFEFGLTQYLESVVVYGAGIASSAGEVESSTSASSKKIFLSEDTRVAVRELLLTPFALDEHEISSTGEEYYRKYFVTPSFHHFLDMLDVLEEVVFQHSTLHT